MNYNGFDLSIYQKGINYDELAKNGTFAILKIGESTFKDSMFETHFAECKKRGLWIGGYYFSHATTVEQARKEALRCLYYIKGKESDFDMPIFIDVEAKEQMKIGKDKLADVIIEFCDTIRQNSECAYGVYANPNFFETYINKNKILERKDIQVWLAHWTEDPNRPSKYNYGQKVWQWGVTEIDGIAVDGDVSFISYEPKEKTVTAIIYKDYIEIPNICNSCVEEIKKIFETEGYKVIIK